MKTFTKFEKARLKRTAQNVFKDIERKNKLKEKILKLQNELANVEALIEITDASTKLTTGGYHTEDIIRKVKDSDTGIAKFEFIYPETIIPVDNTLENIAQEVTKSENEELTPAPEEITVEV